jgi:thiol-disulfide isomerase/thioredoxin
MGPASRRRARRTWLLLFGAILASASLIAFGATADAVDQPDDPLQGAPWFGVDESGDPVVELYFVYTSTCPHCRAAMPFVQEMQDARPWLRVWWLAADSGDSRVAEIATSVASAANETIQGVPTFLYCGTMVTGFDDAEHVGAAIAADLDACHAAFVSTEQVTTTTTITEQSIAVPGVGDVEASSVPLPVFTAIVAGLDAFNPCAFFVLLFLLSLLVHAKSRSRMAIVGMTFVVVSGVMYFVFMAAWLNLFLVTGNLRAVTLGAGIIAVVLGMLSAKDYFAPDKGPSVSIPDGAKPGLFARMRGLLSIDRLFPVMMATIALAVVANSYELLCTAGLPMVFTRVLTLNDLSTPGYYGYLALYNVIYVIPLMAIVGVFVWTLGSRKLQPAEGRTLKLLSGSMMLGLGLVLVGAPQLLESVGTALIVIALAVGFTAAVVTIDRLIRRRSESIASP